MTTPTPLRTTWARLGTHADDLHDLDRLLSPSVPSSSSPPSPPKAVAVAVAVAVAALPSGPLILKAPPRRATFHRSGHLTSHLLAADVPLDEVLLIQAGGSRQALRAGKARRAQTLIWYPDRRLRQGGYWEWVEGAPIFELTSRQQQQVWRDLDRICLDRYDSDNVACNGGRGSLLNFAIQAAGYTGVQYFAVGNGSASVSATDTQLASEQLRSTPTSFAVSGNQASIATFYGTGVGNFAYTEAGIFGSAPGGTAGAASGGATATATANTGMLWAHAPYNYTLKTSSVQLTNNYILQES